MILTLLPLVSLYISCFILMLGFGLIGILLPVRMGIEGTETDVIGLVLAMYAVGMLLGGLYCRSLIARVGYIRVFAASAALSAIAILACSLTMNVWVWGAMRGLMGFCIACSFAVIDGWLSHAATEKTRGRMLATSQITIMAAIFCGQFLLNIAPADNSTLFTIAAMLLTMGLVPLAMSRRSGPVLQETHGMSLLQILKISPLGAVTCCFGGVLYGSIMNLLPVFAGGYGISGFMLSVFMASAVLGAFLLQLPIGMLSDRLDRRTLLFGLLVINILTTIAIPFAANYNLTTLMMILTGISTGVFSCLYPMSISETFDRVRTSDMAAAMGGLLSIYAIGSIIGPITSSKAMEIWGNDALFGFLATFEVALLLFVVYRMRTRPSLPISEQEGFVMHTDIGSGLYDLDPRIPHQEDETPNSLEAQVAITIAESNPGAAVRMVKELTQSSPEKAAELYTALAQVDDIDVGRLFASITRAAPGLSLEIAEALADNAPEQATELVQWLSEHRPNELSDIVTAIINHIPSNPAPATEPDNTETQEESLAVDTSDMRPADLEAYHESATELVTHFAENHPEQAYDIAAAVVETVPEMASDVVDILHDSDNLDDNISMDINDRPDDYEVNDLTDKTTADKPT
ncbi:MFS transporter [Neptunomonas sp.]|uniref:MFS transporter n=1 Tax=Neptunomonas TaxID=75687 RepID=UPI0035135143